MSRAAGRRNTKEGEEKRMGRRGKEGGGDKENEGRKIREDRRRDGREREN